MKHEAKIIDGKMMLISRDIQIGDKVQVFINNEWKYCNLYHQEEVNEWKEDNAFKVIGEISNQATWIVEGDEFELKHFNPLSAADIEHKGSTKQVVRIKGPCGHYH
jgi:hypothetical protein